METRSTCLIESALSKIWTQVLRVDTAKGDDNFFDLGGDSHSAMELIIRIEQELGIELTVADLFKAQTLANLQMVLNSKD